jgi:hypothetical protein
MLYLIKQTVSENINYKDKLIAAVQKIVNRTLDEIREESEEWGLGEMDDLDEIESIDSIVVKDVYKEDNKILVPVTLYRNTQRFDFSNVMGAINYDVSKIFGDSFVVIDDTIDTRNFGPGIDW